MCHQDETHSLISNRLNRIVLFGHNENGSLSNLATICFSLSFLCYFGCRYRFVELYYRRAETIRKGRIIPAKTQTVVIFLPDIRSVMSTRIEWDLLNAKYKRHMEKELRKDAPGSSGSSKRKSKASTSEQIIDGSVLNVIDEVGDDSNQNEMETETEADTGNLKKDDTMDLEGQTGKDEATPTNQKALHTIISSHKNYSLTLEFT